jgi:hypothetical protein
MSPSAVRILRCGGDMNFSKEYKEGFDLWKAAERLLFDS